MIVFVFSLRTQSNGPVWLTWEPITSMPLRSIGKIWSCYELNKQAKTELPFSLSKPCHTKPGFHCIGTEFFHFLEHQDIARKPWYYVKKGLSQRPKSDQDVATELAWRSITFLRSSCWQFSALARLSLHFHGTHNACTALSQCSHRAEGLLNTVTSQRMPYNLLANAMDDHSVCTTTVVHAHGAPIAL